MPTDRGYRLYVDELLAEGHLPVPRRKVELSTMRREVDEAMRATTEQLSQVTNLLALVTAPPIETATIHRIEVLQLQPQVTMVVVITSTGGVTKRVISYEEPVDSGLVAWAASYLNEALGNMDVGSRMVLARLNDAALSQSERDFLATLAPAFTELEQTPRTTCSWRAARLLAEHRFQELSQIAGLMEVLEHRRRCWGVLRLAHRAQRLPADRRGEPDARAPVRLDRGRQLRPGAAQPGRGVGDRPGAHGLPGAIGAVRDAARELSRFVAEVYDE